MIGEYGVCPANNNNPSSSPTINKINLNYNDGSSMHKDEMPCDTKETKILSNNDEGPTQIQEWRLKPKEF